MGSARRLLAVVTLCLWATWASAALVSIRGRTVLVNKVVTITLTGPDDGGASLISLTDRLRRLNDDTVFAVGTEIGGTVIITANGQFLFEVSAAEASTHKLAPKDLAQAWSNQLAQAFALPAIRFPDAQINVAIGEPKVALVYGSSADRAKFESMNPIVASVQRVEGGVRITGHSPGQVSIVARDGDNSERIDVIVRNWAGVLPSHLVAQVTGAPASADAVRGSVCFALRTDVPRNAGGTVTVVDPDAKSLDLGKSATYQVRVRIQAPDSFDRVGMVPVEVQNVSLPKDADSELWYCNSPEVVKSARNLFAAHLKRGSSARLLYHHINGAHIDQFIRTQLINNSDREAVIQITSGDSSPSDNPVSAGVEAGAQYLQSWRVGSSEVLRVPQRTSMPISLREIHPGETISGLCSIRLISGPESVLVRTDSWPPLNLDAQWTAAAESPTPWHYVGANPTTSYDTTSYQDSPSVFPHPYRVETLKYKVGGRFGYLRIGQKAISREDSGLSLDGNFGVIYSITASLENPTPAPADVEIVWEASAGYSGGLFLVDGMLKQSPLLTARQEARITKVHLMPGATSSVKITTVPLSGSSYPITLTIRPAQATTFVVADWRKK